MLSARFSCHILIEFEFSRQRFEKYSSIKFNENPSSGSRVLHANGPSWRCDEANCRFLQYGEGAQKPYM